ncbi:MAG: hypothetical protein HPY89_01220 [Pelotomaculum sp.]|nr:hypothetical protein [Pelotomaculum sp.]
MKIFAGENGAALPLALAVMLVVSLLAAALWQYSMMENLQVEREKKRLQAHYLARAGANAAIAAWLEAPFNDKPVQIGEPAKLYLAGDGTFTGSPENAAGEVEIYVEPDETEEGIVHITATGRVDGVESKVTATSAPYVDGAEWEPPLYDKSTGLITPGTDTYSATVDGRKKTVYAHEPVEGAVKFINSDSQRPLHIQSNTCVELASNAMEFKSPVDLVQTGDRDTGALFLKAEYISFKSSIAVEDYSYWWFGSHYYYGTIILKVPDGLGVDGREIGGQAGSRYGMVFFDDAYIWEMGLLGFEVRHDLHMENKAYYFKSRPDGIDLIRWHRGEYTEGIDYIEIEDQDAASLPQGSGLFYWSRD